MNPKAPIEITRSPNSKIQSHLPTGLSSSSKLGEKIAGKTLDVGFTAVSGEPICINSPGDDLIFPYENTHIRGDVYCNSLTCKGSLRIDGKLVCRSNATIEGNLIVGDEVYIKKTPLINGRIFIGGEEHGSIRPIVFNDNLVIYKDGGIFMFDTWQTLDYWTNTSAAKLQQEIEKFDATWWGTNIYYVLIGYKSFLTQNFLALGRKDSLALKA
jgi:hypothetical protein